MRAPGQLGTEGVEDVGAILRVDHHVDQGRSLASRGGVEGIDELADGVAAARSIAAPHWANRKDLPQRFAGGNLRFLWGY